MTKQVLDVQQMQHLQELGMELKDTILYWGRCVETNQRLKCFDYGKWYLQKGNKSQIAGLSHWEYIPAYTLLDVLYALPARIEYKDTMYYLMLDKSDGCIAYYRIDIDGNRKYARYEDFYNGIDGLSAIDASYELLVWCIDNGYVETNKNE